MPRKVLIVTYYFPPHPSVASLRLRGLARYLPEHGWEPVVLTATHPDAGGPEPCRVVRAEDPGELSVLLKRRLGLAADKSFQEQLGVPQGLRQRRRSPAQAAFQRLKGAVVFPDDMRPWGRRALAEGRALLAREGFQALLSSSGPPTVNRVAAKLQAQSALPWLADFRDLWTQKHDYPYGPARRALERRYELRTLRAARRLVTVSPPLAQALGGLHGKPVDVIENGFDPEERAAHDPAPGFRLVYTGSLYQGAMDPAPLLRVLARLRGRGELAQARLAFYGDQPAWLAADVERLGLQGAVELCGRRPRAEVLEHQRRARLLLLLGWRDRAQRGVTTGKVFEYLAAGRPILGVDCAPGDVIDALLRETGAGACPPDEAALEAWLRAAYAAWEREGDVAWSPDPEAIARYDHRHMAARFAALLDQLSS